MHPLSTAHMPAHSLLSRSALHTCLANVAKGRPEPAPEVPPGSCCGQKALPVRLHLRICAEGVAGIRKSTFCTGTVRSRGCLARFPIYNLDFLLPHALTHDSLLHNKGRRLQNEARPLTLKEL